MDAFNLFEGYTPTPVHTLDVRAKPFGSPQNTSAPLQEVANPMVVEATTWATPRVSVGQSSHEVAPNVVTSMPQYLRLLWRTPNLRSWLLPTCPCQQMSWCLALMLQAVRTRHCQH